MLGERLEAFVREELDELGNSQSRGVAVERVHQADAGRAFRVLQSEVDGRRATGMAYDAIKSSSGVRDSRPLSHQYKSSISRTKTSSILESSVTECQSLRTCTTLPLLTSEPMDVEHEYRSDFRRRQISTGNSVRSR